MVRVTSPSTLNVTASFLKTSSDSTILLIVLIVYSNVDGSYHSVDSSDFAFQMAGQLAVKEALNNAEPVLLEPIDNVELTGRTDDVGAIIGDINARRGEVIDMKHQALKGFQQIEARMPESELLEYAPALRSITAGFGRFTAKFEKYREVSPDMAKQLISFQ